ncbi:hypothetical protein BP6252_11646 [Coleophoma cylindrospora]|uniref:Palmitoyltransferase n=1 Tax=Coleophoma cylindrospora TaxID=1849047 RepID=A0A3D8QK67_9HELO|nr:hypothetical protein BP6252_11646 [Coleophoma cylindrospora]
MSAKMEANRAKYNIWTARAIPVVLAGVVGYATYVLVALLCVSYLLVERNDRSAAIPILVVYFVLFLLMAMSFFRLLYTTMVDPPYLPYGTEVQPSKAGGVGEKKGDGLVGRPYDSMTPVPMAEKNSSFPGLERFYTKDIFRCEPDGKPRWCSTCSNWKPDRCSHCSDAQRCILKMDHFCPWVGGPVGETNFKFFIQFTGYTALFCTHILVVMAIYLHQQIAEHVRYNRHFAAVLGLAGFFGLFTLGMTVTSIPLAMKNMTQVETLGGRSMVYTFAVLVPPRDERRRVNAIAASQITYPIITYPLSTSPPTRDESVPMDREGRPINNYLRHVRQCEPIPLQDEDSDQSHSPPSTSTGSSMIRDIKATRTFAILQTQPGENPWNLGSAFLNWQSVMGMTVLDWFLPFKLSPCCNHEFTESYYALGPCMDELKARVGFIRPEEIRRRLSHPRPTKPWTLDSGTKSRRPSNTQEMRDLSSHPRGSPV